jgi:hypothetical protein
VCQGTSPEIARAYFSKAQQELNFAKQNPNFCCDACGPNGEHTFFACYEAATNAMRSLVALQNRGLPKIVKGVDLKRLVTETAADRNGFETAVNLIDRMLACGSRHAFRYSAPDPGDIAEAIQLTEQFVALIASQLPKEVLT